MDNNYSWGLDYIAHGWGKKPDQKQKEKIYNHEYYMKHRKLKGQERLQGGTRDPRRYEKKKSIVDTIVDVIKGNTSSKNEVADIPCNVLIYNKGVDRNGWKYKAKMKINTPDGKQVWKYFYTQYQIDCYENLIKTALDVDPSNTESFREYEVTQNINDSGYDRIDNLLLTYELKKYSQSEYSDAYHVNPNFSPDNPNTSRNCLYCSEAYAMRRLGFDVKAAEKESDDNVHSVSTLDFDYGYSTGKTKYGNLLDVEHGSASDVMKQLKSYPEGSVGILGFSWKGNRSGHAISWEIVDGEVLFIDTQDKSRKTFHDLSEYEDIDYCEPSSFNCQRLNNTLPNIKFTTLRQHIVPNSEVYTEPLAEDEYYRGK